MVEPRAKKPRTAGLCDTANKLSSSLEDKEIDAQERTDETTMSPADLFFNMPTDGPIARIASFLDPVDRQSFLLINKNLRLLYFKNKAFRIPFEMSSEELRVLLPTLQLVCKIIIAVNIKHLLILKECPELRHLVVKDFSRKLRVEVERGESRIMIGTMKERV
jgi:hypothetical protein